ncbi:MAG: hypothetical protein WCE62_12460 [Polyangiales bacterium]
MCKFMCATLVLALIGFVAGCGDDATEADRIGVGAQCTSSAECPADMDVALECLTQFKDGYCGLEGCAGDVDCPEGSACIAHDDGDTYCFRLC